MLQRMQQFIVNFSDKARFVGIGSQVHTYVCSQKVVPISVSAPSHCKNRLNKFGCLELFIKNLDLKI